MKVNGRRAEDLAGTGLIVRQRYVVPLWVSLLGGLASGLGHAVVTVAAWAVRAWRVTVPVAALVYVHRVGGLLGLAAALVVVVAGGIVWSRVAPASFGWHVTSRAWGAFRWHVKYRRLWLPALDGCGLTRTSTDRVVYVPTVTCVRSTGTVDTLDVRLLHGHTPEALAEQAEGLRHAFAAHRCKVVETAPGRVRVVVYARDPLTTTVPPLEPATVPDLTALPVGLCEDGEVFRLRLRGRQVFIAGASDSGKGSALWSTIRALAPAVHAGTVQLHGVDLKRMELVFAPAMFTRLATRLREAVELLEADATAMGERQDRLSGKQRDHTATPDDPTVVIVIDELAALTAYHTDRELKKRAEAALSLLLSQGRAVGYHVIAAAQDPRKDVVQFRDLFNLRIALRVSETAHVDMLLGDGAHDRGAACDRIPDHLPGVAYAVTDDAVEPVRLRFTYLTDDDIRAMADRWPAPGNTRPTRPVTDRPMVVDLTNHDARPAGPTAGPVAGGRRVPEPRTNLTHERED